MMMKRHIWLLCLGISMVLMACNEVSSPVVPSQIAAQSIALTGSSSTAPGGVSDNEIVVGTSAAFAGPSQGLGIELYRGAMAYIEAVNAAGGVNGRKIVIRAYDDGYNPIPTIDNTVTLVEQDDVFALFNYVGTPTVTRILPLLKRYDDQDIYLFFPLTGAQPQREAPYNEFVFNLRASYRQETAGLVDNFVALGREKIAIFYQIDAYGRSGWDGVKRALDSHGLEIVGEATYDRGADFSETFRPQVDILKESGAEAVIIVGSYQAAAGFIRDARDAGWDVPIANLSFVGSENLLNTLLEVGQQKGANYTTNLVNSQVVPSYEDTSIPAVREYRELMDQYGPKLPGNITPADYEPLPYSFVSFEGFLNAKLLVEILERMDDNPDRSHILTTVEGIQELDLGLDTPISFGAAKHQGLEAIFYTTVKDNQFVPFTDWKEWAK